MKKRLRAYLIMAAMLALSGCASTGLKKVFHDNFADYTPESSVPPLELPKSVELPSQDSYYEIPPLPPASQSAEGLYPPGSRLAKQTAAKREVS